MSNDTVKNGYDSIARQYLAERHLLKSGKYIHKLIGLLPPTSSILDVGCGAGVPIDDLLLKAGHLVTGIDISPVMIGMARNNCPGVSYSIADMARLLPHQYSVDAIVCFYSLFHVSRTLHKTILATFRSYLPAGGLLLISFGDTDFEGNTSFYGTPMWWSQWSPQKNTALVESAGFEITMDTIDRTGSEAHQVVLARAV